MTDAIVCISFEELAALADEARGGAVAGHGQLLPVLGGAPPLARVAFYRWSGRANAPWWWPPHEVVSLDPWTGALASCVSDVARLGLPVAPAEQPIAFESLALDAASFFREIERLRELQPEVWALYLGAVREAEAGKAANEFAGIWARVVRPDQRPYYEALAPEYHAWLRSRDRASTR